MQKSIAYFGAAAALYAFGSGGARATPAPVIVGGLSNFDVTNITGKPEYEFEIELPSVDPASVVSLWQNYSTYKGHDYIGSFATDSHGGTLVKYQNATTTPGFTPVNFVEHFGIHLSKGAVGVSGITYRWRDQNGTATDAVLPTVAVTSNATPTGVIVTTTVTNTTNQTLLVQLHTAPVTPPNANGLELANLVETNSEVIQTEQEPEPGDNGINGVLLRPGEVLGVDGEAHDPTDAIITNRNHARDDFLAMGTGDATDAQITAAGTAALSIVNVFSVDANDARGVPLANFIQALNTAPVPATPVPVPAPSGVPEPGSVLLVLTGLTFLAQRRRWLVQ